MEHARDARDHGLLYDAQGISELLRAVELARFDTLTDEEFELYRKGDRPLSKAVESRERLVARYGSHDPLITSLMLDKRPLDIDWRRVIKACINQVKWAREEAPAEYARIEAPRLALGQNHGEEAAPPEVVEVLGAGGYGTVYLLASGDVLKAIYTTNACDEAQIEFGKQARIHDAFARLLAQDCAHDAETRDTVALLRRHLRVARPLSFGDAPLALAGVDYACSLTMSRLNAVPLAYFEGAQAEYLARRLDPAFVRAARGGLALMGHLALNSEISGLYGIRYSAAVIGAANPPRRDAWFNSVKSTCRGFLEALGYRRFAR